MSERINAGNGITIDWHGKEIEGMLGRQMRRRIIVATAVLKAEVQKALSIPTRVEGPSDPGEIPHRFDGLLIKSIFGDVLPSTGNETEGRVGTKLNYGVFHEITDRPFLRPTLDAMRPTLASILTGGR